MTAYEANQIALGLADLTRFERGHAVFEFGEHGLTYIGTEATVKMRDGEGVLEFVERLKCDHDFQKGDGLHFLNNGGKLDTVRILKRPRAVAVG